MPVRPPCKTSAARRHTNMPCGGRAGSGRRRQSRDPWHPAAPCSAHPARRDFAGRLAASRYEVLEQTASPSARPRRMASQATTCHGHGRLIIGSGILWLVTSTHQTPTRSLPAAAKPRGPGSVGAGAVRPPRPNRTRGLVLGTSTELRATRSRRGGWAEMEAADEMDPTHVGSGSGSGPCCC